MKPGLALITVLALSGGLTACQTATPYQPRVAGAHMGGYSEQRLDVEHWRVWFAGNSATSREVVEKYLLYRAAELTVQQGGDWFTPQNKDVERKTRAVVSPDPFYDDPFWRGYGWGWRPQWRYHRALGGWRTWDPALVDRPWNDHYELYEVDRYVATVEIAICKGAKPDDRSALNAHEVIANLGPSIVRPAG